MKKKILVIATTMACGAAAAQSSVTLFGVIDTGIGRISATGAGHATGMTSGTNSTGRLGFRGTEDLGGGLAASFWLEGELQSDTGNAAGFNFVRRSTVSLAGPFGEIRLGRDFTAGFVNMISFDAYAQRGFGFIENYGQAVSGAQGGGFTSGGSAFSYIRTSNAVSYFLPAKLGGVYGSVQYAFGERNSTTPVTATNSDKQGNVLAGRLGYAAGPLDVAMGYNNFQDISRAATYVDDYKVFNAGASYDFGVLKALAFYQQEKMDGRSALPKFRFDTFSLGALVPVGAGQIRAAVNYYDNKTNLVSARDADATKLVVGYLYNLSKRTVVYADVARVNNKGGGSTGGVFGIGGIGNSITGAAAPTAGGNSTGIAVGVRHAF